MSKHTPGPWYVSEKKGFYDVVIDDRTAVAFVTDTGGKETEKANAHLIAAAPELLKACKEMYEAFKGRKDYKDYTVGQLDAASRAWRAINKAEGR